ncbi:MAG: hypothetical protein J0J03_05490 [Leifsonia sp.]|nr:hypothetical protein [Leifsonia sp.]
MPSPAARDRLPSQEDLLKFILRYVQEPRVRDRYLPADGMDDDFLLLFGVAHRVRRLAQSYLRLRKAGFNNEGQILVRSALEHAVTAQWAHLVEGGLHRFRVSRTWDQFTLAQVLYEESSDPDAADHVAEYKAHVLQGAKLPKVTEMFKSLDNNAFLRTTYKVMSQVTHVTHQAALDAIDSNDDGEMFLKLKPESDGDHEVLYALASCCMLSAWVIAHIEGSTDEMSRLQQFSTKLSMPFRLDAVLPLEQRRFKDEIAYEPLL